MPIATKPTVDEWGEIEPVKPNRAVPLKSNADALLDDMFGEEDKKGKARPKTANLPVQQTKDDLDELLDDNPSSFVKSDQHQRSNDEILQ